MVRWRGRLRVGSSHTWKNPPSARSAASCALSTASSSRCSVLWEGTRRDAWINITTGGYMTMTYYLYRVMHSVAAAAACAWPLRAKQVVGLAYVLLNVRSNSASARCVLASVSLTI